MIVKRTSSRLKNVLVADSGQREMVQCRSVPWKCVAPHGPTVSARPRLVFLDNGARWKKLPQALRPGAPMNDEVEERNAAGIASFHVTPQTPFRMTTRFEQSFRRNDRRRSSWDRSSSQGNIVLAIVIDRIAFRTRVRFEITRLRSFVIEHSSRVSPGSIFVPADEVSVECR